MAETITEDVVVIGGYHMFYTWACAYGEVPPEQVEAKVNAINPSGTSGGWGIILDNTGEHEGQGPVQCDQDPARIHYQFAAMTGGR